MLIELLMAGAALTGSVQDTDTIFPVGDATRLDVESMGGEVVIEAWNRDEIRIQAEHSRRSEVEIRRSRRTIHVEADGDWFSGIVDYRIQVPAGMDVRVEGWQTSISVAGVDGEVEAETFQGEVTISGGQGRVTASSVNGRLVIEGARGEIHAEAVSGSIRISDTSGSIQAEAVGGSIVLEGITATSVEAGTVGGRIRFSGDVMPDGEYFFGTHSGRIVLELPPTANAELEIATLSGSVQVDHGASAGDVRRGRRSRVTLGSGGPVIEVETFSGSVVVREPRTGEESGS